MYLSFCVIHLLVVWYFFRQAFAPLLEQWLCFCNLCWAANQAVSSLLPVFLLHYANLLQSVVSYLPHMHKTDIDFPILLLATTQISIFPKVFNYSINKSDLNYSTCTQIQMRYVLNYGVCHFEIDNCHFES